VDQLSKARDGVEIETSKGKNLREAAEGAGAGGASEATLKYFLDNSKRSYRHRLDSSKRLRKNKKYRREF
jgi:hypothetical protein